MPIRQQHFGSVPFGIPQRTRIHARNAQASRDYQPVENGIKTCMYPGYPELYMQLNKKNEFHYQPDWYRGIEYPKEQERGYDLMKTCMYPVILK